MKSYFFAVPSKGNAEADVDERPPVITQWDLKNHNSSGELWIVIGGKVYDISEFW